MQLTTPVSVSFVVKIFQKNINFLMKFLKNVKCIFFTEKEEMKEKEDNKDFYVFCLHFFSQKWIKENVQWHRNGTMSYSTRKEFTFRQDLSIGDHRTDNLTILNVPAFSAMHKVRRQSYFTKTATHSALSL